MGSKDAISNLIQILHFSWENSKHIYRNWIIKLLWGKWDPVICDWVITGSGNGLSPDQRQASTWTNGDLSIVGSETNLAEIQTKIRIFIKKTLLKNNSNFCSSLNMLIHFHWRQIYSNVCTGPCEITMHSIFMFLLVWWDIKTRWIIANFFLNILRVTI